MGEAPRPCYGAYAVHHNAGQTVRICTSFAPPLRTDEATRRPANTCAECYKKTLKEEMGHIRLEAPLQFPPVSDNMSIAGIAGLESQVIFMAAPIVRERSVFPVVEATAIFGKPAVPAQILDFEH